MRVAVLSSGGKDSSAAIWWAKCKGWDVTHLVTVTISGEDSMTFQIPGTHLVEYQSELCNCSWLQVISSGIEDIEMLELQNALCSLEIDGLVSGALRSDYQKNRIERMCENLSIHSFTPIWHQSIRNHMFGLIDNGFEIMITSVSCDGLSDSWLGKILDYESLLELESLSQKFRFNFDGEGGEYETLVISGPHMQGRLQIESEKVWDGKRGHLEMTPI